MHSNFICIAVTNLYNSFHYTLNSIACHCAEQFIAIFRVLTDNNEMLEVQSLITRDFIEAYHIPR